MKIEMGESLFYSWLRHIKECQVVQTNWKASPKWGLKHREELQILMKTAESYFESKYGYEIFKKNSSWQQVLNQGECDAIGIKLVENKTICYAVDVAFHEDGLLYGSRKEDTVMKVLSKTVRTAMCIYGFMGLKEADILFASPRITPATYNLLVPCIDEVNNIFKEMGYDFCFDVIANERFAEEILYPVLGVGKEVKDTSELFLRSYQMLQLFEKNGNTVYEKEERSLFDSSGKTTIAGFVNRFGQQNTGSLHKPGTHPNQIAYGMKCLECGAEYESNGCDIFQKRCPKGCKVGKV